MNRIFLLLGCIAIMLFAACNKVEGPGGTSQIVGKVKVIDWNGTFTEIQASYYAQDEDVFIIYGDDITFSDKVATNYDGTFRFQYLTKGTYTIFTYSDNTDILKYDKIAKKVTVEITENGQTIELDDILVDKK